MDHTAMDEQGTGNGSVDVKALLYRVIERLGRDNLRRELVRDSRSAISTILHSCMNELKENGVEDEDTILGLTTALMHYLLTEYMIQSERKIQVDDTMLDIVIPSMRALRANPGGALIILLAKGYDIGTLSHRLAKIYMLQPERENIWVVITGHLDSGSVIDCGRVYVMDDYADPPASMPISTIIDGIKGFMGSKGIRPFNIVT